MGEEDPGENDVRMDGIGGTAVYELASPIPEPGVTEKCYVGMVALLPWSAGKSVRQSA